MCHVKAQSLIRLIEINFFMNSNQFHWLFQLNKGKTNLWWEFNEILQFKHELVIINNWMKLFDSNTQKASYIHWINWLRNHLIKSEKIICIGRNSKIKLKILKVPTETLKAFIFIKQIVLFCENLASNFVSLH